MRDANQTRNVILTTKRGKPYGIILAPDAVSEHEWGIQGICARMRRIANPVGFDQRIIAVPFEPIVVTGTVAETRYEGRTQVKKQTPVLNLLVSRYGDDRLANMASRWEDATSVTGAFDEHSFMVRGWDKTGIAAIEALAEGMRIGDFAIWMGSVGDKGSGLCLIIPSRMPKEYRDAITAADEDRVRLKEASDATGIHQRVPSNRYFALSPHWIAKGFNKTSAHPVIYWLNPMAQRENNFGYFTVEELDEWMAGSGPIPINK